jgi:AraC family transcriptional regulator
MQEEGFSQCSKKTLIASFYLAYNIEFANGNRTAPCEPDVLCRAVSCPARSLGYVMHPTASNAVLRAEPPTGAPSPLSDSRLESVRLSSRGLGWSALNFERRDSPPSSRALPNGSKEHLIFVSLSTGRIVRESGGQTVEHELSPGCVAVVPSRTPIRWTWPTNISLSVLTLDPAFLDRIAQDVFGLDAGRYRLTLSERASDAAVTNIAGVLSREVVRREPGGRLYAKSLANILAVHLLRSYAQCDDGRVLESCSTPEEAASPAFKDEIAGRMALHPRAVAEAVRFIQENYARDVSLNDIAESVHLSPFHVARLFKQALGVSPHQYLIQVRVNSARSLLSAGSGERSLAEVASAVGFADQSHLTRHFKRLLGVTPKQLRP